jgi:hypothetical protein
MNNLLSLGVGAAIPMALGAAGNGSLQSMRNAGLGLAVGAGLLGYLARREDVLYIAAGAALTAIVIEADLALGRALP